MPTVEDIQELLYRGRYLEARVSAEQALRMAPEGRLRQLYALALSKSGAPEAARDYLEPYYKTNVNNSEAAGILGGIYKELFKKNHHTPFAQLARDTYLKNFQATGNYYTGINAAAMSAMLMQASRAKEIAAQVAAGIRADTQDFWEMATLAEANLLLKKQDKAIDYYSSVRRAAGTDWGKVATVHNQIWLLSHFIAVPREISKLFSPPRVAAFVGHMIDRPGRATPRLPASLEATIKEAIKASIRAMQLQVGFCSLACGSDILFAEALLELGGEINALLPFNEDDFENISLRFAGEHWVERFRSLLKHVPYTYITHEPYQGHDDLFSFQSKIIFGSAVLRSGTYHTEPYLLTVLSETDLQRKEGGTRDAIGHWPFPTNIMNINPENYLPPGTGMSAPRPASAEPVLERPVQYLIRVDLTHLNPIDQGKFDEIRNEAATDGNVRIHQNDMHFTLAFEYPTPAFNFIRQMLSLLPPVTETHSWRAAIHAGPLSRNSFPSCETLQRLDRLEEFALPGQVCALFPFAALLALERRWFEVVFAGAMTGSSPEEETVYQIVLRRE